MQQLLAEQELITESDESYDGTPICGGNFSSVVVDTIYYLDEITYSIGGRTYIENAD